MITQDQQFKLKSPFLREVLPKTWFLNVIWVETRFKGQLVEDLLER